MEWPLAREVDAWRTMNRSRVTVDHDEIRTWAESRGGKPVAVRGTGRGDVGIRIDVPGTSGAGKLAPISWDEWFDRFDRSKLAIILEDETARGQKSNFHKLVARASTKGGNGESKSRRGGKRASSHTRSSGGARRSTRASRRGTARTTSRRGPGMSASRSTRTHAPARSRKTSRGTSTRSRSTSARSRGRSSRRSNR